MARTSAGKKAVSVRANTRKAGSKLAQVRRRRRPGLQESEGLPSNRPRR